MNKKENRGDENDTKIRKELQYYFAVDICANMFHRFLFAQKNI